MAAVEAEFFMSIDRFLPYFYRDINPIIHRYEDGTYRLNENQIKVMMAVCKKDGLSPVDISRLFMIPKTSLTTIIRSLMELGLLEKEMKPSDPRRFSLRLSADGQAAVAKIRENNRRKINELFASMDEETAKRVIGGFHALNEFFEARGRGI